MRVDPAGPEDQVAAARRADRLLALELAAAVDLERPRRIALDIGLALGAVEHVVGGEMHQVGAAPARRFGEYAGRATVDRVRRLGFALGAVDGGVGGGVDDGVGPQLAYPGGNGRGIGEIAIAPAERGELADAGRQAREFPSHLAVATEDEQPQG